MIFTLICSLFLTTSALAQPSVGDLPATELANLLVSSAAAPCVVQMQQAGKKLDYKGSKYVVVDGYTTQRVLDFNFLQDNQSFLVQLTVVYKWSEKIQEEVPSSCALLMGAAQ